MSSPVCFRTASTTLGWLWPTFMTAMPALKSMYVFPSTSSTTDPWARFATMGDVFVVVARYFAARAMISRALGPGGVTLIVGTFTGTPGANYPGVGINSLGEGSRKRENP